MLPELLPSKLVFPPQSRELQLAHQNKLHRCVPLVDAIARICLVSTDSAYSILQTPKVECHPSCWNQRTLTAAAYSIIINYQVKVLCCETAHVVYVRNKKRNSNNPNTQQTSSGGDSSTMYACKTDFSIAQTTPQSSSYIFLHWNKQKKGNVTHTKKHHHPGFQPRTTRHRDSNLPVTLRSLHDNLSD